MELTKGTDVFSSVGEKIGKLERVVLDPETKEVTHLIIEKGILFTTNRVVPIDYVKLEVEERITLDKTAQELEALPSYDPSTYLDLAKTDYPDLDRGVEAVYYYPPLHLSWWAMGGRIWYPKPKFVKAEKVIPEGTIALEEGAKVISKDGEHLGNIERVIVEPSENRATHIVISEGLFSKERKLIPSLWIREVDEDEVHLSVWSDLFDQLPVYEPVA